jgi:hypothetical protein
MCSTATSDGVIIDNSGPSAGAVQDGTGYYEKEYHSMTLIILLFYIVLRVGVKGLSEAVNRGGRGNTMTKSLHSPVGIQNP